MQALGPRRPPAYQELAGVLRQRILAGEWLPGDRLPIEPQLCELYAVSRSTVREALRVLASENLVDTRRGVAGGTFVSSPEPERIGASIQSSLALLAGASSGSVVDLLEVRELLEVPAAALAAQRRSDAQVQRLRDALFDPRDRDVDVIFDANRDFHLHLLRAANNPLLEAVTMPIFGIVYTRFRRSSAPSRFWHTVDQDHREILDRVDAGDAAGAKEAQQAHLERLRGAYTRMDRAERRPPVLKPSGVDS